MVQLSSPFASLLALCVAAGTYVAPVQALAISARRAEAAVLPFPADAMPGVQRALAQSPMTARTTTKSAGAGARTGAGASRVPRVAARLFNLPLPSQLQIGRLGHAVLGELSGDDAGDDKYDVDDRKKPHHSRALSSRILGRRAPMPPPDRNHHEDKLDGEHEPRVFSSRVAGRRDEPLFYANDVDAYAAGNDSDSDARGKDTLGAGNEDLDEVPTSDDDFPEDGDDEDEDEDEEAFYRRGLSANVSAPLFNTSSVTTLLVASVNGTNETYAIHPFVGTTIIPSNTTVRVGRRSDPDTRTRIPGNIDIVSPTASSDGIRLASLFMTNTTAGNATAAPKYALEASSHNHTEMYLVVAQPDEHTMSSLAHDESASDVPVYLQMDVFDQAHAAMEQWCATYSASPNETTQLAAEPCQDSGMQDAHKSQLFLWNKDTSAVRPMFWAGMNDGMTDNVNDTTTAFSSMSANTTNTTLPVSGAHIVPPASNSTALANGTTPANTTAPSNTSNADAMAAAAKQVAQFEAEHDDMASEGLGAKLESFQSTYDATASHPPLRARSGFRRRGMHSQAAAAGRPVQNMNVTLVFRPDVPQIMAVDAAAVSSSSAQLSTSATTSAASATASSTMASATASSTTASSSSSSGTVSSSAMFAAAEASTSSASSMASSMTSSSASTSASASSSGAFMAAGISTSSTTLSASSSSGSSTASASSLGFKAADVTSTSVTSTSASTSSWAQASSTGGFNVENLINMMPSASLSSPVPSASSVVPSISVRISTPSPTPFKVAGVTMDSTTSTSASVSTAVSASSVSSSAPVTFKVADVSASASASPASSSASATSSASAFASSSIMVKAADASITSTTSTISLSSTAASSSSVLSKAAAASGSISATSFASTSSSTASAAASSMRAMDVNAGSSSSSAVPSASASPSLVVRNAPAMTPVSTEPYTWRFTRDRA